MTSVFKVNPRNILGLEHQKFKSQLLALALAEPHTYFRLRDKVYTTIVEEAVGDAYELYWSILKEGKGKDGNVIKIDTEKYISPPGGGGKVFSFVPAYLNQKSIHLH